MVLQLVGGSHRFTPQNAHQTPSVVILCGGDVAGSDQDNSHLIIDSPSTIGLAIARCTLAFALCVSVMQVLFLCLSFRCHFLRSIVQIVCFPALFRNLANHCVRVVVCLSQKLIDSRSKNPLFATEMKLLKMTDAKVVHYINGTAPSIYFSNRSLYQSINRLTLA